jgi:hypothetical protein
MHPEVIFECRIPDTHELVFGGSVAEHKNSAQAGVTVWRNGDPLAVARALSLSV